MKGDRSPPLQDADSTQTSRTKTRQRSAQELKSHLWNCAEVLRGSAVDRTDWKAYILPLLFFKRICDVWDEETGEAQQLYGDIDLVEFPEVHRFNVPEGCHWRDVRATPANLGAALSHAMREMERTNPDTLYRVFGAADWGNREAWQSDHWGRNFLDPPKLKCVISSWKTIYWNALLGLARTSSTTQRWRLASLFVEATSRNEEKGRYCLFRLLVFDCEPDQRTPSKSSAAWL